MVTHESVSEVAQSCPTLCDPIDCSLPGSSVHGILQARILEWVAMTFSRESAEPGIEPESPALQTNPYHLSRQGSPQLCSPSHLPRYQGVKLKQISGGEAKNTFFPPILILDVIILKNLCHLSILTESSGKDFLIIISTTEIRRRNFHIFVLRCEIGTTTTICTNLEQFVRVKKNKMHII